MHMTLLEMMKLNPRPFDMPLLKMALQRLLFALDFLHTEADLIHTSDDSCSNQSVAQESLTDI